jgi:uncharacterized protein with HEPN domain
MRADEDRQRDILDAINAIRSRVGTERASFDADAMVRVWCLHYITVIGEATSRLSEDIRHKHTAPPWGDDHRHAQCSRARLL